MNADWAAVCATILIAAVTGGWAVLRWSRERREDRDQAAEITDLLYLVPFTIAARDLRSRLNKVLGDDGLEVLRAQEPPGRHAMETIFLLARFLAWEQQLLRFTYLAGDAGVVDAARHVRDVLASGSGGVDPWCLFRTTQTALGQSVIVWRNGAGGFADTISIVRFERRFSQSLAHDLGLEKALLSLQNAKVVEDLSPRTRKRLTDLNAAVEKLLDAVNQHVELRRGNVSAVGVLKRSTRASGTGRFV